MAEIEIPKPEGIAEMDSWKASATRRTHTSGKVETIFTYEITHEDKTRTIRTVTVDSDGKSTTVEEKKEAEEGTAPSKKPIPIPQDLPPGAGWSARRTVAVDVKGVETMTVYYTINQNGNSLEQVEIYEDGSEIPKVTRGEWKPTA